MTSEKLTTSEKPAVQTQEQALEHVDRIHLENLEEIRKLINLEDFIGAGYSMMAFDAAFIIQDGKIVETSEKTGNVVIIPMINGLPVREILQFLNEVIQKKNLSKKQTNTIKMQLSLLSMLARKPDAYAKRLEEYSHSLERRAANHNSAFRRGDVKIRGEVVRSYPVNTFLELDGRTIALVMKKAEGTPRNEIDEISDYQELLGGGGEPKNIVRKETGGEIENVLLDLEYSFVPSDADQTRDD